MKQGQNIVNKICGVFSVLFAVVLLRGVIVPGAAARAQEQFVAACFFLVDGFFPGEKYCPLSVAQRPQRVFAGTTSETTRPTLAQLPDR